MWRYTIKSPAEIIYHEQNSPTEKAPENFYTEMKEQSILSEIHGGRCQEGKLNWQNTSLNAP
jgi:hypothetical protein